MSVRFPFSGALSRVVALGIASTLCSFPLLAQKPAPRPVYPNSNSQQIDSQGNDVSVGVRDPHGVPLDAGAIVHLFSLGGSYNVTTATREVCTAHFSNVVPGDYQLEVTSPGYRKATEQLSFMGNHADMPVYVYLVPESDVSPTSGPPWVVVMSPQLRSEVEKALQALHKKQFEAARKILTKAAQKAPGNPDVLYFLGVAELGLQHSDLASEAFQHALTLDPNHELALVSLGELQLKSGSTSDAIATLEKAVSTDRAGWRAHFELASAYLKVKRYGDAESEASRSARLAKNKTAVAIFLLGEIQYAESKRAEAKQTWEYLLSVFPNDPIGPEAKKMLARLENDASQNDAASTTNLPPPPTPDISLVVTVERPWAPPDLDSTVFDVAPDVDCKIEQILDSALRRMKSELVDFEKFTATEHVEHQQIDRYGWPGPVRSHDFAYIVLIYPLGKNSFYLEESRGGGNDLSSFPSSVATVGLNSLGVSVLQPYYRGRFNYSCEGLTNLRGQAAWQVRFEEKRESTGGGVRQWRKDGRVYDIPVKGRIWISSSSNAVLRVETELRDPVAGLELTKDHLLVDYGPVKFSTGNEQLWLPWSADMYMELRGKRYHHRHFLSDYMLFGVDTTHKINKPKELPPPTEEVSP
jgi:tetratricopeptide (TPR) repeat protein